MSCSFVIGNSWQLNFLSERERRFLDQYPWVFCLNDFPFYWKLLNFRPKVWVHGDNHDTLSVDLFARSLKVIETDAKLMDKIEFIFAGKEKKQEQLLDVISQSNLRNIITYKRGHWQNVNQKLAKSLDDVIYHCGSTLSDVINFAWILNPEQEIRIVGCQYKTRYGHFYSYDPLINEEDESLQNILHTAVEFLWWGIVNLVKEGIPIIDCNFKHGEEPGIPKKKLLEGLTKY